MALQFILGPARSGKTTYIYDRIIRESMEKPDQEFFLLVPDQSTLNAQRELVTRHPAHGTMNIDVVGFFRLAYRIFEELSYVPKNLLEDEGKSMVIRKVMEKNRKNLKIFGSSMKKPGFIEELKSFFAEMYQYDVSRKDLEDAAEHMKHPALRAKMDDILLVMTEFEDYIQERYLISEQLLDVLAGKMEESRKLKNAVFYLDGFTGFTPIQRKVIQKLMKIGQKVFISMTVDEAAVSKEYREYELFALPKKERMILMRDAMELGVKVEKDIFCRPDDRGSAQLRHLERNLFRYPYRAWKGECQDICLFQAMNPRTESQIIAGRIETLVRKHGYQYKDIVVLTADLESYGSELERSFQDFHIPYFVDANRKLKNNPCIETILSALKMIQKDFSYDMVFRYLKSGFSCLNQEEADLLENYVIAMGIQGYSRWNRPFETEIFSKEEQERIEPLRIRFMDEIRPLKEGLKKRGETVLGKLTCLYEFLERLNIEQKMEDKKQKFEEAGDPAQAKTYGRVYGQVLDLMEQMADILGEEKLSYDDFLSVLETGMEEMTMGVIPPSLDQVVIGDMERTRTEGVKVLFFAGVSDNVIPKQNPKGNVISDSQKEMLEEEGIVMAPTAKAASYMEQFYLYLTTAKPEDKLYVSYSVMTASGDNQKPSYFLERIRSVFPELKIREEKNLEIQGYTPEAAMNQVVSLLEEETLSEEQWRQLAVLFYGLEGYLPAARCIDGKFYQNQASPISRDLVKELYGDTLRGSVTRMEQFAGCAFSHFMKYGLKLKERMEHQILPMDMGQVFHKTMELVGKRTDWKFADDESRDSFVDQTVEDAVSEVQQEILESSSRNHYLMDRMKRISRRAVWAMEQYIRRGDFTPEEYEIAFSEENQLKSMNFSLENGEKMVFSGVVDRMDSIEDEENKYIRIIDYKSGDVKFDFAKVFHGLQMQLIIYMNAMLELYEKKGEKRVLPAGMFYFHINDPIVKDKKKKQGDAETELLKEMKMSGVANSDFDLISKMEHSGKEGILSMPVTVTTKGLDKRSSIMDTSQMLKLGTMVEEKIIELGNALMKGDISIRPYEYQNGMPCNYCSFRHICAYENGVDPVKRIKSISLEEGKHALDEGTAKSH